MVILDVSPVKRTPPGDVLPKKYTSVRLEKIVAWRAVGMTNFPETSKTTMTGSDACLGNLSSDPVSPNERVVTW